MLRSGDSVAKKYAITFSLFPRLGSSVVLPTIFTEFFYPGREIPFHRYNPKKVEGGGFLVSGRRSSANERVEICYNPRASVDLETLTGRRAMNMNMGK